MNQTQSIIENFKKSYEIYQLGCLTTESVNPLSTNLSSFCKGNLPKAISVLKEIDLIALNSLLLQSKPLIELSQQISETLKLGKRVFLFGCGATGRLSLSLEFFGKCGLISKIHRDQIIAFMSGGDLALIKSISHFEDNTLYGANHLMELGFEDGDLLISTTEGGETPIVIGATEKASQVSSRKPYFLYCNSDEILISKVERSKNVLLNEKIKKIPLVIAPMALSGSTRMQASTVLMLAVGAALKYSWDSQGSIESMIKKIIEFYEKIDILPLKSFIEQESEIYLSKEFVIYMTSQDFGITILTDTAEKSPTFSLNCFENTNSLNDPMSLCYLCLKGYKNSEEAWNNLLKRKPRCLEWEFCKNLTDYNHLLGYNISEEIIELRKLQNKNQHIFSIDWGDKEKNIVNFTINKEKMVICFGDLDLFEINVILKMILNTHSTLVMGRIGRYESNVMTYVKPSNCKLIDRSIRYIRQILKDKHELDIEYEKIMELLSVIAKNINEDEPFVLKATDFVKNIYCKKI